MDWLRRLADWWDKIANESRWELMQKEFKAYVADNGGEAYFGPIKATSDGLSINGEKICGTPPITVMRMIQNIMAIDATANEMISDDAIKEFELTHSKMETCDCGRCRFYSNKWRGIDDIYPVYDRCPQCGMMLSINERGMPITYRREEEDV